MLGCAPGIATIKLDDYIMQENKKYAWEHLTKLERTLLHLYFGHSKTLRESAIITNLAPYKAQEILYRAKKFFILFSDYYILNDQLIPLEANLDSPIRLYLYYTLKERLSKRETMIRIALKYPSFTPKDFSVAIDSMIPELKTNYPDTYELILSFDKWNSHRILPKKYRRESPFPRRQMKSFWPMEKTITGLSEISYRLIKEKFKTNEPPMAFLVVVGSYIPKGLEIIQIPLTEHNLRYFGRNQFLVFEDRNDALVMGKLCLDKFCLGDLPRPEAFKFWPVFRNLAKKARTIDFIMNIEEMDKSRLNYEDIKKMKY